MGSSNSSTITIKVDRNDLVYFTNEIISGTVELNATEGQVETDGIYIQLTGEIGYTTKKQIIRGKDDHIVKTQIFAHVDDRVTTETVQHNVPFYSTKTIFAQPKAGQKQIVYSQGKHLWPFEIRLTDHLPPTMNEHHSYPHVRYYLQVVIDKPWYKPNTRETKYLTIFPRVNLLHNPQCLQPITFGNHNRKDITLKGTLNKSGYISEEIIQITLDIDNPRQVLIKSIVLSMVQSYRIGENPCEYNVFDTTIPNIMNSKNERVQETCSIRIPFVPLPPSYQYSGGTHQTAFVHNHYKLKFVVKVEGMFTNFDVDIPITLGTEPNPDSNHQNIPNSLFVSNSSNAERSMFSDHDLPPSYASAARYNK